MDRTSSLTPLLRALWNIEVRIALRDAPDRLTSTALSPVLDRAPDSLPTIHLPLFNNAALSRAATLHAAAHIRHGDGCMERAGLKPIQQALASLLEDARIEWLTMCELPGVREFWRPYHHASATDGNTLESLLARLATVLFDPACHDPHPWIRKARAMFFADPAGTQLSIHTPQEVRYAASLLGNDIGQMRMSFNPNSHVVYPIYRDDNSHLWNPEDRAPEYPPEMERVQMQDRIQAVIDRSSGEKPPTDTPDADGETQEMPPCGAGSGVADLPRNEMSMRPVCVLPEWDRLILRYRPEWCRVFEYRGRQSDHGTLLNLLASHASLIRRIGRALQGRAAREERWMIRSTEGSEFCPAGLIDAGIALRAKQSAEERVFFEARPGNRRPHITFLIDTSVSTGRPGSSAFSGQGTVLDEMRAVVTIACAALEQEGLQCSVLGFCSNTRELVRVQPVKSAEETVLSTSVLQRLAGLTPAWSTRLGAVLRYATTEIRKKGNVHRIVLVTDGEPYDVDVHDPSYLEEDFTRAIAESARKGVKVVSLAVGSSAGTCNRPPRAVMPTIFVDSLASLPVALERCVCPR